MSFLDNLENSLKSLESSEERDSGEQQRRENERSRSQAAAPWAERLKTSPYTQRLFEQAAIAGHRIRTKIYMAWMDSVLRLEARGHRLDLQPTPEGIVAVMTEPDDQTTSEPIDLGGNPEDLLARWLTRVKPNEPEPSYGEPN